MMKRIIKSFVVFFFIGITTYGQSPTWSVNENDFEYTMSFVAFLNIDGNTLASTNDKVAVFVNGECRGVTNLIYEESKQRYYAYLNVFSNSNGETLSFKVYDSVNDKVVDISKTVDFDINALQGNILQAFSIASPTLNTSAEIISFDFEDVFISNRVITNNEMILYVDNGQNISALNAVFELSSGAKLINESIVLESENNTLDFSTPILFQVLSEDESQLVEWTISVENTNSIDITYYKKDAVCYHGGAIKVLTSSSSNVELFVDQTLYATQTIINGETVFNNLESGTYSVKINGSEKEILINLKN